MMIPLFISAAVVLVVLGGLLAAADAALAVVSRSDLVEMALSSRSRTSLLAISNDVGTHTNAINFMRVVSETTRVKLIALMWVPTSFEIASRDLFERLDSAISTRSLRLTTARAASAAARRPPSTTSSTAALMKSGIIMGDYRRRSAIWNPSRMSR